jgi:hypothetical protein
MMPTNNTISSDFYDTTAVYRVLFSLRSSCLLHSSQNVKPTVPTHMKYLASHTFVVAHLNVILLIREHSINSSKFGRNCIAPIRDILYTSYHYLFVFHCLFSHSGYYYYLHSQRRSFIINFRTTLYGKIKKMLRSTASLLSRSGVARRVVRSSSSAFMSSSSSVATTRQVSAMQNSFVRSMNSASTIIEDDGSDYGFGESIPEQEIPEEFIEEGEETIVSHSKYILITVYRLLFAQTKHSHKFFVPGRMDWMH